MGILTLQTEMGVIPRAAVLHSSEFVYLSIPRLGKVSQTPSTLSGTHF